MKFTKDEIRSSMLLYAVTDRMWLKEGESLVDVAEKVLQNGATFLQIREKDLDEESFEEESEKLKALCNAYHVPFVVNDSVEIALQCGADGVHVGQSDIKGRDIRAIIGPDKILGISAGTVEQAIAAEKAGADYIGVGAVFPTSTKKDAKPMEAELLRRGTQLGSTVLKVGHHGSRTSSSEAFLQAVKPRWAVISCGYANSFGHPHREIVQRISDVTGAELLRTDEKGASVFRTDGDSIKVECYRS